MPIKFIPDHARPGMIAIRQLTDTHIAEVRAAVNAGAKGGANADALFRTIESTTGDQGISRALQSLYTYRFSTESAVDQLAADVTNVMLGHDDADVRLPADEAQSFRDHLQDLLSIDSLSETVKAEQLAFEHANIYYHSKVVTDIRPVFGDDISAAPHACILSHNLHIHYVTKTGDHHDLVVGMDSDDFKDLQSSIDRAHRKTRSLTQLLKAADVYQIDLKEKIHDVARCGCRLEWPC